MDLPQQLGLDLVHCERAAETVVSSSEGVITQAQGELFSKAYFDGLGSEVDEELQEAGVVAGAWGVCGCVVWWQVCGMLRFGLHRGGGVLSACASVGMLHFTKKQLPSHVTYAYLRNTVTPRSR